VGRADEIVTRIDSLIGGSANRASEISKDAVRFSPGATDDGSQMDRLVSMEELAELLGLAPDAMPTRAELIDSGQLVPIDRAIAREAGFRIPVAVTAAVWADCIEWGDADTDRTGAYQDQTGRLWDVLFMTSMAARRASASSRATVRLHRIPRDENRDADTEPPLVELIAIISPGDEGEPVMTITQPDEAR
jgi:hypothetical protein